MKKQDILEETYRKTPNCSVGDLVFALRTKGKLKAKGSYWEECSAFLAAKNKQRKAKLEEYFRKKRQDEFVQKLVGKLESIATFCLVGNSRPTMEQQAHRFMASVNYHLNRQHPNKIIRDGFSMGNAFNQIGI